MNFGSFCDCRRNLESKEQSKQWISTGETAPKKAKIGLSANKVMVTVFWDARGVIHVDYLEKGRTINGEYYSNLLGQFDSELKKKRPHMAKKKVLFHQDNAPAHKSVVAMMKLCELHYEILPNPPYSPDLAPCDYYLFPNLKKWLGGKKFQSNEQVICETNAYFEDLDQSYFMEGQRYGSQKNPLATLAGQKEITWQRCGSQKDPLATLAGQKEITWQHCGSQKDPLATLAGQREITWQRCGSQKDPLATLACKRVGNIAGSRKSKFECGRALPTEPYNSHDNHSSAPALLESAYRALLRSNNCDPSSAPAPTESAYRALLRLNGHSSAPALLESAYRALLRSNNSDPSSAPALTQTFGQRCRRGSLDSSATAPTNCVLARSCEIQVQAEQSAEQVRDETAVTLAGAGSVVAETTWSFAPTSLPIIPGTLLGCFQSRERMEL
ncbi:hypothetical protein ACLKA6_010437 [Drosophila palustris]